MRTNCRFALAVHLLTLLSCKEGRRGTSDSLGASVNTNPVVIRRILNLLRASGIIETHKGAGAGSTLARCPSQITLAQIYRAVEKEEPFLFPLRKPKEDCPVGQRIKTVLQAVFASVETALESELNKTTLADICQSLGGRLGSPAPPAASIRPRRPCRGSRPAADRRRTNPLNER
jgi:Rrf2 family protein